MSNNEDILLNDLWTVYFHDPANADWTNQSYVRVGDIASVDDFWAHANGWEGEIHKGMFFIMRDGVFPCWDDAANIDGGVMSIKVLKENLGEFWNELCMKIMGETLLIDADKRERWWDNVNGISTSPKKHFCIVKIWVKSHEFSQKELFDIATKYYGDILYKSNRDNIENDNLKRI